MHVKERADLITTMQAAPPSNSPCALTFSDVSVSLKCFGYQHPTSSRTIAVADTIEKHIEDLMLFLLLELPTELQINFYKTYFRDTAITTTGFDKENKRLKFQGMPGLNLELVSRSMRAEASNPRTQGMDRGLLVK